MLHFAFDMAKLLLEKAKNIPLFDLSWVSIFSYLVISVKIFYGLYKYRRSIPNAFRLKKYLRWKYSNKHMSQWSYCKFLFKILSSFKKLDIKIVKYLSENPGKSLLNFAEENNYFTIETENDQNFSMEEKSVDHFIEKELDYKRKTILETSPLVNEAVKALLKRSEDDTTYKEFINNLTKQLSTIAKKAILHNNPEFKKSFENLKDQELLFSNKEVDEVAITNVFEIVFNYKK